jgi:hypothetical protein
MDTSDAPHEKKMSPQGYNVGQLLTLHLMPPDAAPRSEIRVRIEKLHTRTLSCTMSVSMGDDGQRLESKTSFIKLFDRRFSEQLREDNGIDKWSEDLETSYIQSIRSGSICRFLEDLHNIPNFQDDTEEDWDDAENEAFLADELRRLFTTEAAAYEKLHTL